MQINALRSPQTPIEVLVRNVRLEWSPQRNAFASPIPLHLCNETGQPIAHGTTLPTGSVVIAREAEFDTRRAWVWWSSRTDRDFRFGPGVIDNDPNPQHVRDGWTTETRQGPWPRIKAEACEEARRIKNGSLGSGWTVWLEHPSGTGFVLAPESCEDWRS